MKYLLACAAIAAVAANAFASGDYGPSYTMFKAYTKPDIPNARFQAGDLGVLQPGMRRVYLYTAWRAIMLGAPVAQKPGTEKGLDRADGSAFGNGWDHVDGEDTSADLIGRAAKVLNIKIDDPAARLIVACPAAANAHAAATLRQLEARPDANRARVDAWLRAQYQVGESCQRAEDARYSYRAEKLPEIVAPQPLPATEPAYWRQLRDYQRAAWQFHGAHYAESTALFDQIGAAAGHPMQGLGAYLALRSEVRRAVAAVPQTPRDARERQAQVLDKRGAAIVADASLHTMHEPVRALLRAMRVRLTPESRLDELNRYLADPAHDPYALDRLGDWSILMDDAKVEPLRGQYAFIDWVATLQDCASSRDGSCAVPARHALERWQQGTKPRGHTDPWLVAALMLSETLTPALEQGALAVDPADPAYLTVRYHLARLYRLAGKRDAARAVADAALKGKLSPGTRNLFREERFAVATSVRDAGAYLLRANVDLASPESAPAEDMLNDDAIAWFKRGMATADMLELARAESLPQPLRARIAGAAWIRAALLDQPDTGRAAADLLAKLVPAVGEMATRYARAATPAERRHVALVASVAFGLSADLDMQAQPVTRTLAADATASAWCSFKPSQFDVPTSYVWRLPAPPELGDTAARRTELGRLEQLKTATGTFGDDVLQWADTHPADPELPWLLHVVVMSTRGGCLDKDASALSRKAHALLHKRWPRSEWARATPYFY
jgi:hypothetical protein